MKNKFKTVGAILVVAILIIVNIKVVFAEEEPICSVNGASWSSGHKIEEDGHCTCDGRWIQLYWCDSGSSGCTETHATKNCI